MLILSFCLITSYVYAERWVCQSNNALHRFSGDGYTLGLCEENNVNILPECIEATQSEYNLAGQSWKKLDTGLSVGNRVIDMNQTEIDTILQAEADAQEAATIADIDELKVTIHDVIVALVKRINVRIPSNPITKAEVIQQIKDDR